MCWLFIVMLKQKIMLTVFILQLRFSALPIIYIETTRNIYPYFGTSHFLMGQVTLIRSLVPNKWLENKFSESCSGMHDFVTSAVQSRFGTPVLQVAVLPGHRGPVSPSAGLKNNVFVAHLYLFNCTNKLFCHNLKFI